MAAGARSDDQESLAALQGLAIDLGCNFFDTAWAYGEGKSDGLLGEHMSAMRESGSMRLRRSLQGMIVGRRCRNYKYSDVSRPSMSSSMPT